MTAPAACFSFLQVVSFEEGPGGVTLQMERTGASTPLPPLQADFIVGCDGMNSGIRTALMGPQRAARTPFGQTTSGFMVRVPTVEQDPSPEADALRLFSKGNQACFMNR